MKFLHWRVVDAVKEDEVSHGNSLNRDEVVMFGSHDSQAQSCYYVEAVNTVG